MMAATLPKNVIIKEEPKPENYFHESLYPTAILKMVDSNQFSDFRVSIENENK